MNKANPVNIAGIDHVVLRTARMEAMCAFYIEVLGCRLERGPGDIGLAQLRAGSALIDLVDVAGPLGRGGARPAGPAEGNMDHLCLQVLPWDEEAVRGQLQAHGIEVGEVAQRYGTLGQGPSLYIDDPDGNTVELKGTA